jgi:hypothetical protein
MSQLYPLQSYRGISPQGGQPIQDLIQMMMRRQEQQAQARTQEAIWDREKLQDQLMMNASMRAAGAAGRVDYGQKLAYNAQRANQDMWKYAQQNEDFEYDDSPRKLAYEEFATTQAKIQADPNQTEEEKTRNIARAKNKADQALAKLNFVGKTGQQAKQAGTPQGQVESSLYFDQLGHGYKVEKTANGVKVESLVDWDALGTRVTNATNKRVEIAIADGQIPDYEQIRAEVLGSEITTQIAAGNIKAQGWTEAHPWFEYADEFFRSPPPGTVRPRPAPGARRPPHSGGGRMPQMEADRFRGGPQAKPGVLERGPTPSMKGWETLTDTEIGARSVIEGPLRQKTYADMSDAEKNTWDGAMRTVAKSRQRVRTIKDHPLVARIPKDRVNKDAVDVLNETKWQYDQVLEFNQLPRDPKTRKQIPPPRGTVFIWLGRPFVSLGPDSPEPHRVPLELPIGERTADMGGNGTAS